MWFLCWLGACWKGIDQWWGSVYSFPEPLSKAITKACWGQDVWSHLMTFEVGLRLFYWWKSRYCYFTTGSCHFSITHITLCTTLCRQRDLNFICIDVLCIYWIFQNQFLALYHFYYFISIKEINLLLFSTFFTLYRKKYI